MVLRENKALYKLSPYCLAFLPNYSLWFIVILYYIVARFSTDYVTVCRNCTVNFSVIVQFDNKKLTI